MKRIKKDLNEKTAELKEITANMSERELEIEELKRKVEMLKETMSSLKLKIATVEMKIEANTKRLETIDKEARGDISSSDSIKIHEDEVRDEFNKIAKTRNTLKEQIESLREEKARLEEFFSTFTDKENVTIYGYSGTYAQEYASTHNIKFVDLNSLIKGDVNFDGKITPTDASEILGYYAYTATGGALEVHDYFYQQYFS